MQKMTKEEKIREAKRLYYRNYRMKNKLKLQEKRDEHFLERYDKIKAENERLEELMQQER